MKNFAAAIATLQRRHLRVKLIAGGLPLETTTWMNAD
jgi:hypothetical protein